MYEEGAKAEQDWPELVAAHELGTKGYALGSLSTLQCANLAGAGPGGVDLRAAAGRAPRGGPDRASSSREQVYDTFAKPAR